MPAVSMTRSTCAASTPGSIRAASVRERNTLRTREQQIPRSARDDKERARDDKEWARDDKERARDDKEWARDDEERARDDKDPAAAGPVFTGAPASRWYRWDRASTG